ncbi:MAG: outer membrane beta-barrel protein [Ectothiorhodospiraceae bacterium]
MTGRAFRSGLGALLLLASVGSAQAVEPGGWYVAPGAQAVKLDGWDAGSGAALTLGWKLPYQHSDTPRSSVALELELADTAGAMTRGSGGNKERADVRQAGAYLALNTYMSERWFHQARLGALIREIRKPGDDNTSGRLGFGLGLGFRATDQLEVLARGEAQFLQASSDLLGTATLSARWHF